MRALSRAAFVAGPPLMRKAYFDEVVVAIAVRLRCVALVRRCDWKGARTSGCAWSPPGVEMESYLGADETFLADSQGPERWAGGSTHWALLL